MKEELGLPLEVQGLLWLHTFDRRTSGGHVLHHHDELEASLVVHGRATYLLNGRKYELHPRDMIWLFPAQSHVLLDQSPDFSMWILVWKPKIIQTTATLPQNQVLLAQNPEGNFHRRLGESQFSWLNTLFEKLNGEEQDHLNAGLVYALMTAWKEFNAAANIRPGEEMHPSIERVARLLRDGGELKLEELAHKVGLSPSHLSRLFKQQTGMALSEFRNRQRVEAFFQLYGHGHRRSLSEAARAAGFGSYPQFHRVFKQIVGQSPAEFAAQEKERG